MKKVAVVGSKGKMGRIICDLLNSEFDIVEIDKEDSIFQQECLDLVIDFASHESSVKSAEYCVIHKIPIIIGSTGQTVEENRRIKEISKHITVVKKANFAQGINIIKTFIESVLVLKPQKFEIIEKHHINKKDSPSGTALEIKKFIRERFGGDVEIKSIREGQELGEHTVVACLKDEKLEIKHNAFSREIFAKGVLEEVRKLLI